MDVSQLRVAFAQIDAKGGATDRYDTVGFYFGKYPDGRQELSKELNTLSIFMEREYLTKLAALQDEIEAKYVKLASQITSDTKPLTHDDDTYYGHGLDEDSYNKAAKAAKEEFPGREADYYT